MVVASLVEKTAGCIVSRKRSHCPCQYQQSRLRLVRSLAGHLQKAANGHREIRAIKTFMDAGLKGHCVGWFCLALYGADVLSDVPYMYPTNKKALTRLEVSACNVW